MTEDDLIAKFRRNALLTLNEAAVAEAHRRWWRLGNEADIRQTLAAVAMPAG